MKLLATIYSSRTMDWKVRIEPRVNQSHPELNSNSVISLWTPPNGKEAMLIYDPKISVIGKPRYYGSNDVTNIYFPISQLYGFIGHLSKCYRQLSDTKLYHRDGKQLYLDKQQMDQATQKLPLFGGSILIMPGIITERDQGDVYGVQFVQNSKYAGAMSHYDTKELCDVLTHLDVQSYTMILSIMERIVEMDGKLDTIISMEQEILQLLKADNVQKAKLTKNQSADINFTWKNADY